MLTEYREAREAEGPARTGYRQQRQGQSILNQP